MCVHAFHAICLISLGEEIHFHVKIKLKTKRMSFRFLYNRFMALLHANSLIRITTEWQTSFTVLVETSWESCVFIHICNPRPIQRLSWLIIWCFSLFILVSASYVSVSENEINSQTLTHKYWILIPRKWILRGWTHNS